MKNLIRWQPYMIGMSVLTASTTTAIKNIAETGK